MTHVIQWPDIPQRRMAALIAGAAVLALGAVACGGSSGSASGGPTPGGDSITNVTLGYVPYADDAALFYAQDSGIFRKHGLNVSFVAQASPVAVEASMQSGTEQFGFVTMKPRDFLRYDWFSNSARWSALTSGMTSGTSSCMRSALELETTAHPASAKRGSSSAAMAESRAAKIIFGAPSGVAGDTFIFATAEGMGVFRRQRAASS